MRIYGIFLSQKLMSKILSFVAIALAKSIDLGHFWHNQLILLKNSKPVDKMVLLLIASLLTSFSYPESFQP